jgi:hypothetical protein
MAGRGSIRPRAGVRNIESSFIARKGESIWTSKIIRYYSQTSVTWIKSIDVTASNFTFGFAPFVVSADTVNWIREPNRAIRSYDDVVRRIETLSFAPINNDGNRSVYFSSGDSSCAVLAGYEATLAITRISV